MLTADERRELENIIQSPDVLDSMARRAEILLLREQGMSMRAIAEELETHYNVVYRWLKRFENRPESCTMFQLLSIAKGRGLKPQIDESAIAWLRAENKKRLEAGERISAFSRRINQEAVAAGHPRLATASRNTITRLVRES